MAGHSIEFGILTILTGVGLLGLWGELSDRRWLRSAGQFDLVAGGGLVVLGISILIVGLHEDGGPYLLYVPIFLVGLLLLRTYYALEPADQRRERDGLNAALLSVPSAFAMLGCINGLALIGLVAPLAATLASILALLSIPYDAFQLARGEAVYIRDVVTAILVLPLPWLYLVYLLMGVYPA
ncbi:MULTISPECIES: hypothetical protein [Haloarcula]|uniref:hypothetical protein n=1 Tax=Haloarcula TaxID=2237 RepID=UPI0023E784DC|nr:hypothetical protein [Halomicroarcula sp. SHR3]